MFSQFLREGIWIAPDGVEYMGRAIRTDRYRYVEWKERGVEDVVTARELYDLRSDPEENVNIAGNAANRPIVTALRTRLQAGWRAAVPK